MSEKFISIKQTYVQLVEDLNNLFKSGDFNKLNSCLDGKFDYRLLFEVLQKEYYELFMYIIDYCKDKIDINKRGIYGMSIVMFCIDIGFLEGFYKLLDMFHDRIDINIQSKTRRTLLMLCASSKYHKEFFKLFEMYKHEIDFSLVDSKGKSLFETCLYSDFKKGADKVFNFISDCIESQVYLEEFNNFFCSIMEIKGYKEDLLKYLNAFKGKNLVNLFKYCFRYKAEDVLIRLIFSAYGFKNNLEYLNEKLKHQLLIWCLEDFHFYKGFLILLDAFKREININKKDKRGLTLLKICEKEGFEKGIEEIKSLLKKN